MRLLILPIVGLLLAGSLPAARLKDIVDIEGVRDNQLIGYGLVVGLAGTGDQAPGRRNPPDVRWSDPDSFG